MKIAPLKYLETASRNPLILTVVGFVLSTLVGAYVADAFGQYQRARDRQSELIRARKETAESISRLFFERRYRSVLLSSSMRRPRATVEELSQRRLVYDDVTVRWNAEMQINQAKIREFLGDQEYADFNLYLERYVSPMFTFVDGCLTDTYDEKFGRAGAKVQKAPVQCDNADRVLTTLRDCGYAITDGLFRLSDLEFKFTPELRASERVKTSTAVSGRCAGGLWLLPATEAEEARVGWRKRQEVLP